MPCVAMSIADSALIPQQQQIIISIGETVFCSNSDTLMLQHTHKENINGEHAKKKLLAGFLSFPFPMGFLGAHRILLGTKPWVPVVYVATFGGCFGLLPLIDFCVIMLSDDVTKYENNPNIFMWVK